MTTQQSRSLALLVLTTVALGSLTSVTTVAEPAASNAPKAESKKSDGESASSTAAAVVDPKIIPAVVIKLPDDPPQKVLITGQVVLLADALQRRKIKTYAEETKGQVVLETMAGELLPVIPDWRGRAFFQDQRLRDRKVTLLVHQRKHVPYLQVLSIFTYDDADHPQLTDYWCDICSIPMYEIKKCECCQGPTRLRFQKKDLPNVANETAAKK